MKQYRASSFLHTDDASPEDDHKLAIESSTASFREHNRRSSHGALTSFLSELGIRRAHEVAATLLAEFGSVSALLSASYYRLRRLVGHRVTSIVLASRDLFGVSLIEEVARGPILGNRTAVAQFLRAQLGMLHREQLMALYLAPGFRLLKVECVSEGSVTEAPLEVPKIIHRALDLGAQAFVLAHNHPSGDPAPSDADRRATVRLARIAEDLGIRLVDHLIVGRDEVRSMMEVEQAPPS